MSVRRNRFFSTHFVESITVAGLLLFGSINVFAFKVDTHAWVGQQVINDLADDGKITVNINGNPVAISVPADVVEAILNNQPDYLLGNVGPDAVPDVLAGQILIHPGSNVVGGWDTNDWLAHMMAYRDHSPDASAFIYGVLGHASADVFAHTYVNQYSGDVFDLFSDDLVDGFQDKGLVEERHFFLESYISKFTPPLTDINGVELGRLTDVVELDEAFSQYVLDVFLYNEIAQEQYALNAYTSYLNSYYHYRQTVDSIAEDGIWREIDIFIVQMIAKYYGVDLSHDQAGQIVDAGNEFIDAVHVEATDEMQIYLDAFLEEVLEVEALGFETVSEALDKTYSAQEKFVSSKQKLEQEALALQDSLAEQQCGLAADVLEFLEDAVDDFDQLIDPAGALDPFGFKDKLKDKIDNWNPLDVFDDLFGGGDDGPSVSVVERHISGLVEEEILEREQEYEVQNAEFIECHSQTPPPDWNPEIEWVTTCPNQLDVLGYEIELLSAYPLDAEVDITYTMYNGGDLGVEIRDDVSSFELTCISSTAIASGIVNAHIEAVNGLEEAILEEKEELIQSAYELRDESVAAIEAFHQLQQAITDLIQRVSSDVSPIQSLLRGWREDIDMAMTDYTKAAAQMILNSTDPEAEVLDPLVEWINCYHLALIGVPSVVAGCDVMDTFSNLTGALTNVADIIALAPLPDPAQEVLEEFQVQRDELTEGLKQTLAEEIEDALRAMLPQEVEDLIEILDSPVNDDVLNQVFTIPDRNPGLTNLLMLPDMAQRVRAEMGVVDERLNPDVFPPIHNAIVLAKLALLDQEGLKELAILAGVDQSIFDSVDNVVQGAFSNIDGNHQWMANSPPLPNALGAPYRNDGVSYSTDDSDNSTEGDGLLLWSNVSVRDELFRSLFIGPLSSGVDSPEVISFEPVVPKDYPYDVCKVNAYPNSVEDKTCTLIKILPSLMHSMM